jgi:hypothetical protein
MKYRPTGANIHEGWLDVQTGQLRKWDGKRKEWVSVEPTIINSGTGGSNPTDMRNDPQYNNKTSIWG